MGRPATYRETYLLTSDVPYRNANRSTGGTHSSEGVLHQGRVVWLQAGPQTADPAQNISAYAEGVGIVELAASVLTRA